MTSTATATCPNTVHCERRRLYRASGAVCQACVEPVPRPGRSGRPHDAVLRRHRAWMSTSVAKEAYSEKASGRAGLRHHQGATGRTEVPAARPHQRGGRVDHVGHRLQPAHSLADLALPRLHPATPRAESPSRFLILTAPAVTLHQSIATFNSPGKSRSANPTGLSHLLLPATLYITSGTGSTANFPVGDFNAVSRLSDPHEAPTGSKLPGWRPR